jgi:predicted dehydrogenase
LEKNCMTDGNQGRQLQLGIIGTGLAVEKLHWPALKRMPERFRTVAFANRTRPKAEHFSQYSGVSMNEFTADYEELLRRDDVEVVLISLPIPLNLSVTRAALEAGKHVVCEKPAGSNEAEGREYVELVAKYPEQTVLVAENWFYRDDLRYARSLLDEGVIGRVHLVAWRTVSQLIPRAGQFSSTPWRHHPDYEGGAHLDGGVHHLAEIRLLCGDVARLAGETQDANTTHGGPSDLSLNLRFVSGAIGSYTAAYPELAVPAEPNDLRLYGTEGVMTLGREGTSIYRADGSVETYRVEQQDGGYYNEFLNFHEAVTAGASLVGTAAQSYRNMELVLKGLASADVGQVITLDEWPIPLAADAVPLWRPAGATDLFEGLEVEVTRETRQTG